MDENGNMFDNDEEIVKIWKQHIGKQYSGGKLH